MKSSLLAIVLCLGAAVIAGQTPPASAQRVVPSYESQQRVSRLTSEIHWYHQLADAQRDAEREGKLIFWVQMLGQIDGAT